MQPIPSSATQPAPRARIHRPTRLQAPTRTADGAPDVGLPVADTVNVKESA
ncbi:hypothetical protein ACFYO5_11860 [Streptomyces sp. NPDC006259]|uniref:hypothetical protein n=1 Tax=Streptomyces sp. NPDC006259 TaxID=3364740 RepID=UPI00368483FD